MPNNSGNYHSYQRLKGEERPVESLMLSSVYKKSFKPTQYVAETVNFYRFAMEDENREAFWYFIHKGGYLPDPLSTIAPKERQQEGFLNRIFPLGRSNLLFLLIMIYISYYISALDFDFARFFQILQVTFYQFFHPTS